MAQSLNNLLMLMMNTPIGILMMKLIHRRVMEILMVLDNQRKILLDSKARSTFLKESNLLLSHLRISSRERL